MQEPSTQRAGTLLERALAYGHVDRSAVYGGAARVWSVLSGPVTLALIASTMTPAAQGYYFAFSALLALQVFAEFGLGSVIVPVASHEWAFLQLDARGRVTGSAEAVARLRSIASFVCGWYGIGAASAALLLGVAGSVFFSQRPADNVSWQGPWMAVCLTTGASLFVQGLLYVLEGSGQVRAVYRCNLLSGVATAIGCWIVLLSGGGLWAAAVPGTARVVCALVVCGAGCRSFWSSLIEARTKGTLDWRTEIWPFQWRIGVSWLAGYFINALMNPVVFQYEGPTIAGQLGMSLALASSVPWIGFAMIQPRTASFGALIANRDFATLDDTFWRLGVTSLLIAVLLCSGVLLGVILLTWSGSPYATRLLSPMDTGILLLTGVLRNILQLQSKFLRSHKAEPLMLASIAAGIVGACVTLAATQRFGVHGTVLGYLAVTVLFELPISTAIFYSRRRAYRRTPTSLAWQ